MAEAASVINKFLQAVAEAEEKLKKIEEELGGDAARLLAKADEMARSLAEETDKIIEEYRRRLEKELEKELERLEKEYREREERELSSLRDRIERNRERAVEEALNLLARVVRG
ncbi:hypothetical protein CF15_05225 [Pyrodictium occultum]|uniref:V-type ATP synthase subunit H n=1 Tax=Pyrodictium occultum TaxID=2309 RepID=A0A0V8RVU9_PYROC|nr:hypothetical protein [Pyrodictium occultum]KSW12164.1 hypothetical protein CF15_05225 [Pyrodictium occultum]